MPIFVCRECLHIENTALANYWYDVHMDGKPARCTQCDPGIGKWHGEFTRRSAIGWYVDQSGHLWSPEEVKKNAPPSSYKLLGVVLAPK